MLRYNRNRARGRFFPLFSPRELFYGSVPGAWYDPTDLSTMFQDSTGTTPVTAVEQPVGRILDKSGNANHATQATAASRPTYRARYNLLTYSEQFDDAAWVKDSAGTGVAPVVTPNAGTAPDGTTTADRVQFNRGAGTPAFSRIRQTASAVASTTCTWSVWMRTFSGTGTQFIGLRIDGTGATCTVTGTWQRFQISATSTAADCQILSWTSLGSDQTADLLVWGAQLLTAADVTATGNAYQRIAAATVYDTAPIFRPYLAFDGVDDSLSTASIDFTSTDKMSVFSGVTKNSDSAFALIVELTTNTDTFAGGFNFFGANQPGYYAQVGAVSDRVFGPGIPPPMSFATAAPTTDVVSLAYDRTIPSSVTQIQYRIDAQGPSSANLSLQGVGASGVFANAQLFIGRRNNASFPFNGRLFSLIVRGAASSVTEIADTELWVNARTGGY